MAVKTRRDYFGLDVASTPADRAGLAHGGQTTGFVVQPNKAVVVAPTPSRMPRASTRTACSRRATPTRSCAPRTWAGRQQDRAGQAQGRNAFKQRLQELGIEMESEAGDQRRLRQVQGPGRPQERHLRRGHHRAGDGRVGHRRERALPASVLSQRSGDGERPHAKVAFRRQRRRTPEPTATAAGGREPEGDRVEGLQTGAEMLLYSVNAITSWQHTAGRGDGSAAARRPGGQRRRGRSGHRRGVGEGLSVGVEQAAEQDRTRGAQG